MPMSEITSVCARCARRLGEEETSLREQYAVGALRALRHARDKGYIDLVRLKGPEFEILRSREDFQELLQQMNAGPDKHDVGKPDH